MLPVDDWTCILVSSGRFLKMSQEPRARIFQIPILLGNMVVGLAKHIYGERSGYCPFRVETRQNRQPRIAKELYRATGPGATQHMHLHSSVPGFQ